jgi:transcription antitermination factor NusG
LDIAISANEVSTNGAAHLCSVGQSEQRWFAAYTCANHEKRVAALLHVRAVEHFLPLYSSLRRWKDRRVRLELPLFPGYIFVRLARSERLQVLEAPGIVRLVGFNGQPYALPDREVESLSNGIKLGLCIQPHPYLSAGARVRIKRGPLGGAEGILIRRKNTYRVVLSLDLITRSASVEVDASDVDRIS